jgi:hypothetical protein
LRKNEKSLGSPFLTFPPCRGTIGDKATAFSRSSPLFPAHG